MLRAMGTIEGLLKLCTDAVLGNTSAQLHSHTAKLRSSLESSVSIDSLTHAVGLHKRLHDTAQAVHSEASRVCGVLAVAKKLLSGLKELEDALHNSSMLTSAWGLVSISNRAEIDDEVKGAASRKALKDLYHSKVVGNEDDMKELLGDANFETFAALVKNTKKARGAKASDASAPKSAKAAKKKHKPGVD